MRRQPPPLAAVLAVSLLLGFPNTPLFADTDETLSRARAFMDRGECAAAVASLEEALAETPRDRQPPVLDLLRKAYGAAARDADARGLKGEAEQYRDNLEILGRKQPAPPAADAKPAPVPVTELPPARPTVPEAPASPAPEPAPRAAESVRSGLPEVPEAAPVRPPAPKPGPPVAALLPPPSRASSATAPVNAPAPAPDEMAAADAAFQAQRYDEAGRLY